MEDLTKEVGKFILLTGFILIAIGGIFLLASFIPDILPGVKLKKLPGDILIKKDNFVFFFPLATSILISIILTIILNLLVRILRH